MAILCNMIYAYKNLKLGVPMWSSKTQALPYHTFQIRQFSITLITEILN